MSFSIEFDPATGAPVRPLERFAEYLEVDGSFNGMRFRAEPADVHYQVSRHVLVKRLVTLSRAVSDRELFNAAMVMKMCVTFLRRLFWIVQRHEDALVTPMTAFCTITPDIVEMEDEDRMMRRPVGLFVRPLMPGEPCPDDVLYVAIMRWLDAIYARDGEYHAPTAEALCAIVLRHVDGFATGYQRNSGHLQYFADSGERLAFCLFEIEALVAGGKKDLREDHAAMTAEAMGGIDDETIEHAAAVKEVRKRARIGDA